jgi:hypothetical protein
MSSYRDATPESTPAGRQAHHETIDYHESVHLVGPELTRRVVASCRYCYGRDERGVPEWAASIWSRLLARVLAVDSGEGRS